MNYLDSGLTRLFYKTIPSSSEMTEDISSSDIPLLTGSAIAGGIMRSQSGKIQIDWDKGQILIGDGAHWRVLIGEDGL